MRLLFKELNTPDGVRSMYVALPDGEYDKLWKSSSITVLREGSDEDSVKSLIKQAGLDRIVDGEQSIIAFPNPTDGKWHSSADEPTPDEKFIIDLSRNALPGGAFSEGWRTMADVHYLMGLGSGATLTHAVCARFPSNSLAAAICTVDGDLPEGIESHASYSPIPALIAGGTKRAEQYFIKANQAEEHGGGVFLCPYNNLQKVVLSDVKEPDEKLGKAMWKEFFAKTRRTNTSAEGDVDRRIIPEKCGFIWHIDDTCLGDNGGIGHTWIESIPSCVRTDPDKKVPLVLFSHGMSDNCLKAADMAKLHELGEREGFITIYPQSSDGFGWNLALDSEKLSDVDYYTALINHLKKVYPIDETRIYTSGFSNGAGMAMIYALTNPEIIAASFPVDSTFPYASFKHFKPSFAAPYITKIDEEPPKPFMPPRSGSEKALAPLNAALEKQKTKRCYMPVFYFYGTRESEYPIKPESNQELSYNFWKKFNGIPIKPTTENLKPDAIGVNGDKYTEYNPCAQHPDHSFVHHVFYTQDGGHDYYNFHLMRGKAHDVHPAECEIGWRFASRFSRNADGSLNDTMK